MLIDKMVDFLKNVEGWTRGEYPLSALSEQLGDGTMELGRMMVANGVCDFKYKLMPGYSYQAVVNVILLYISLRYALTDKDRRQHI